MRKLYSKFIPIIILILGFMSLQTTPVHAQSERLDLLFNRAYNEKDPAVKVKYYQKILEIDPNNSDAYNNMGVAYKDIKMYERAIDAYRQALKDPAYEHPEFAYNNMGLVYSLQKDYKEAIKLFKKAIEINPDFKKAYNNMGVSYKNLGDFDRAMAAFERAVEIDPNFTSAKMNLRKIWRLPDIKADEELQIDKIVNMGNTYFNQGKLSDALEAYNKVLAKDDTKADILDKVELITRKLAYQKWYNKGFQEMQDGDWKRSYESFSRAIKATREQSEIDNVTALQKEVEFRLKKEVFIREIQELYLKGLKFYKNKEWNEALSIYNRIFAMDPNFRDVKSKINECRVAYLFKQGMEALKKEDILQAKSTFKKVIALFPNHVGAKEEINRIENTLKANRVLELLEKAKEKYDKEQYNAASIIFTKVLGLDKNSKEALNAIHNIEEMNQEKKLKSTFSKITVNFFIVIVVILLYFLISKLPKIMQVREYYQQYKDLEKAKVMYEEILRKEPTRRVIYHPLARIYKDLRQNDKIAAIIDIAKDKILDADSSEVPLWYACIGELHRENDNLKDGVDNFEKAHVLMPDNGDIQKKLIVVYEEILMQGRENAEIRFKLAELYFLQGKLDMALAEFELVSRDPNVGEKAKLMLKECLKTSKALKA